VTFISIGAHSLLQEPACWRSLSDSEWIHRLIDRNRQQAGSCNVSAIASKPAPAMCQSIDRGS
jgi:hypothetical protein